MFLARSYKPHNNKCAHNLNPNIQYKKIKFQIKSASLNRSHLTVDSLFTPRTRVLQVVFGLQNVRHRRMPKPPRPVSHFLVSIIRLCRRNHGNCVGRRCKFVNLLEIEPSFAGTLHPLGWFAISGDYPYVLPLGQGTPRFFQVFLVSHFVFVQGVTKKPSSTINP